jgi:hypothetical protein
MNQSNSQEKNIVELSKAMVLDSLNNMQDFQGQMVDFYLTMTPWITDEVRQFLKELLKAHKKGQETIQNLILRKLEKTEDVLPFRLADIDHTQEILLDIEKKVLDKFNFGFNPDAITLLNDPNVSQREIEGIKGMISVEILAKIMEIANSAYFGTLKKGKVTTFYDAVIHLGMKHTELLILYFSLFILAKDRDMELIMAKSFARYVLGGYVYAKDFGLNNDATYKVELGCLFMDIGKIIIHLYRNKFTEDYDRFGLDEVFVEKHHSQLGFKVCERFNIPEEMKMMIFNPYFTLDTKHIALSGILKTVYFLVEALFRENHGKLVLTSPMPDTDERLTYSLGVVIQELFSAVGLSGYLEIIDIPTS